MYTKPLGNIIQTHGLDHHLYADDSQSYMAFRPTDDAGATEVLTRVETCLAAIRKWMGNNMLKVNDGKTEVILFASKHNAKIMDPVKVLVGDVLVQSVPVVRDLGVMLDTNMSMEKHINTVCKSAYFQLRKISHIRRSLTETATKTLIHALVTSRIDYCNALLHGLPKRLLQKLQRVQNAAARIVTKTSRRHHITPVLKELHWLPVEYRIRYKVLVHTYRALHDLSPVYIKNLLCRHETSRLLRSQSTLQLTVPRTRTATYGDRSFQASAPMLWNKLPCLLKCATTLDAFKKALKTNLFTEAYDAH